MKKLCCIPIKVGESTKEISVFDGDVLDFEEEIDILTTSAFVNSYAPIPFTIFRSLYFAGISVEDLAREPLIDLKSPCHIWLSKESPKSNVNINRIGCIELSYYHNKSSSSFDTEQQMINSLRSYFSMLDIASIYGVKMSTIALPLLGSGCQAIDPNFMIVPLINECLSFLKRNPFAKRICFIEKDSDKAAFISDYLQKSFRFIQQDKEIIQQNDYDNKLAFISYSSKDKNIADNLCAKLENSGIKVWYAPRDVKGPYAEAIVNAIDKASHFIVILSQNSIASQHVLNEIDLAFQNLPQKIKFKPLRIDNTLFTPSFKYYLSRQHWMDAFDPPLENRLNEFVDQLLAEK